MGQTTVETVLLLGCETGELVWTLEWAKDV